MTEKVKVTKEQADEIEIQKKELKLHDIVQRRILSTKINNDFKSIELDKLIRALYIGYEVEQELKVGDWVAYEKSGRKIITKIIEIEYFDTSILTDYELAGTRQRISVYALRHATSEEIAEEKERRWWAKHGRDVWELREGDFLVNSDKIAWEVTRVPESEDYCFIDYTKFHYDRIKNNFLVLCFAENRLDVKE